MDASFFIARRITFKGNIATVCIAISFLVMMIAVSVSSGFRREIYAGVSSVAGDILISPPDMNILDSSSPIEASPSYLPYVSEIKGVKRIIPGVANAAIVKNADNIHGVLFKGVPDGAAAVSDNVDTTVSLAVSIPKRLSEITGLAAGDRMLAYFVGENVKARQFNIVDVYEPFVSVDDKLIVYASMSDLQKVNGWNSDQISYMDIILDENRRTPEGIQEVYQEAGTLVNAYSSDSEAPVIAVTAMSRYPQLFDWLDLIDFNVFFILMLMTVVAGFNMISGLLIMLFENISMIGLLKALGMTDRAISKLFLSSSAVLVLKGMGIGNALAVIFCLLQKSTHFLRLDPANYFVSSVPVHLDLGVMLLADIVAFASIMLLLLIPCLFISKVDPAQSVRVR